MAEPSPLKVFVSYAHEDEPFKNKLIAHLKSLERQGLIDAWHDGEIRAGADWEQEINREFDHAEVILLLVSSDFFASDFCWGVELERALERHDAGTAAVIPIILRSVDWESAPFAKLQARPQGGKPVNTWEREDDAFTDIAKSIRNVIEGLIERRFQRPDDSARASADLTTAAATEAPPAPTPETAAEAAETPSSAAARPAPIKVGILLSRTGNLAMTEGPMIDATVFAIREINERGGVLGRKIEPIVKDAESREHSFEKLAEELITEHSVATIFGCCTSSSRKTVKKIVEEHDHLLIYPMQHEGLERSRNIIYLGSAPNQQFLWAAQSLYAMNNARRIFLIGSDYVYPHAAAAMIRDTIEGLGGEIVGEEYIPLASYEVSDVANQIAEAQPDAIVSQVVGSTNLALYKALRKRGVGPPEIPTLASNMTVGETGVVGPELLAGDFSAWSYFMEIEDGDNVEFLRRYREVAGTSEPVSDPMEVLYAAVHLWSQAVTAAGSDEVGALRGALLGQSFAAPEGRIEIDAETQYARRIARLAQVQDDGSFKVIFQSGGPVVPEPYPKTRSVEEWHAFLTGLYEGWGGRWENPVR